jgi:hypothetical protein
MTSEVVENTSESSFGEAQGPMASIGAGLVSLQVIALLGIQTPW